MAYIRVAYKKSNIDFDYVPGNRLDTLIARDEITHFFRPAEKRWVSVKFDAVRREREEEYQGPERRRNDRSVRTAIPEAEDLSVSEETPPQDWLESLWQQVENS